MAVNQPQIGKDQADNSWKLEVTTQVNNEEARINDLASRLAALESGMGIGGGIVRSVDTTGILRFNGATGELSSGSVDTLQQNDYLIRITSGTQTAYQFTMAGPVIPETHMIFLGGMRLCESTTTTQRDYSISGNTVILTRASTDFIGLDLILTVFTLA